MDAMRSRWWALAVFSNTSKKSEKPKPMRTWSPRSHQVRNNIRNRNQSGALWYRVEVLPLVNGVTSLIAIEVNTRQRLFGIYVCVLYIQGSKKDTRSWFQGVLGESELRLLSIQIREGQYWQEGLTRISFRSCNFGRSATAPLYSWRSWQLPTHR